MILHEIGYLIVGSVFHCWLAGSVMTCPVDNKVKPANVAIEKIEDYESAEVHYEVSGLTVFDKKGDSLEIRKKNGQKIRVSLSELKSHAEKNAPKPKENETAPQPWQYESLEEIVKNAMLGHEVGILSLLKKDDLKTPLVIPKTQIENLKQKRIDDLLLANQMSLPIAYFEIATKCTYKKISDTQTQGTCASPGKAVAYKSPDRSSEKILDASLTWAHLEGRPTQMGTVSVPENKEELLVFEEHRDWVRMKLAVLPESKRTVWINKKDIPYKMVRIASEDRIKTLIHFLNPPNVTSSSKNISLADNLKSISESSLDFDVDSANEVKWMDGILWVKVIVRSQPHCAVDESNPLGTAWLPYIDPKTKKKVLSWYSRGC